MSFTVADPIYYNKPFFRFARARPMNTKKNLVDQFIEEDSISPSEDAIKVYLRLKPTVGLTESNVIQVLDSRTLLFKMPQELMQARNKLNIPDQYKYSFSQIYEPNTTQSQIYTGCVAPLIKDLFNGQHCLLFTYGTTNAGKTYTVLGNGDNPGIIPRTLTTVFKSISGKEYENDQIVPDKFNSAMELTTNTLLEERKFKDGILTWTNKASQMDSKLSKTNSTTRSSVDEVFGESVFKEMQKRLTNDTSIIEYASESDDRFSVWVSFAEIYNEAIYDLLQPVVLNSKRKQLKLGQDNNNNYYIKGLKHVFVRSEEEAYKVLMFGKTNLQVAATGMNSRSSRSHCIFTIKLIKSPNVESPEHVVVSSFAICDLAGAERQKKTLNVGLRLKESQNINCSLHVLSRCFTVIRENQLTTEPKIIPFRDSKLTQLFKHALTGRESVTMIVNVNSDQQLCEETQHVLKASAIAKHIVVLPRKTKQAKRDTRQSMFSTIVKHNRSTLIPWDSCVKLKANEFIPPDVVEEPATNPLEQKQEKYENLLSLVEELKEKLKEEKHKHNETKKNWLSKEEEIRQEVKKEFTKYLEEMKQEKNLCDKKAERDNTMKKRHLSPYGHADLKKPKSIICKEADRDESFVLKDLQEEVKMQQSQIDGLTDLVNCLRDEKKELGMELALARLNLSHRERDITNLKAKVEMFREESSLHEKYLVFEKEMEEKIKYRDRLLDEAKEDWLAEVRAKDDLEDEVAKLEKELSDKEEEMVNRIEELKERLTDREDEIELLRARIENMEYMHEDELKVFKIKCLELEEKLLNVSNSEGSSSLDKKINDLEQQLSALTAEKEVLVGEKSSMEEQLARNVEEFRAFRQEAAETLKCATEQHEEIMTKKVYNYEQKLRANDEEITKLNEDLKELLKKLNIVEESLLVKIKEAESAKLCIDEKEKELNKVKTELESEITKLNEKSKEEIQLSLFSNELEHKCELLTKCTEENNTLEKTIKSLTTEKNRIEEELRAEISALEASCKKQLQETTRLWESKRELEIENEKLSKDLSKVKNITADLNKSLKAKEHELDCCRSKLMGYEQMVPTIQSEFDAQRKELLEYKKRCDNQKETIINMEKELSSFQINQKEIIGKYEENLRKSKEENESLKKEVARVTTTFYKSTPTPKKVFEKQLEDQRLQIEDLKNQLDDKETHCERLLRENETLSSELEQLQTIVEGPSKEDDSVFHEKEVKSSSTSTQLLVDLDARRRTQSCVDKKLDVSDLDSKKAKSASKARTRRTTRAAKLPPAIIVTQADDSRISENKPAGTKKQTRKKLWDATFNDEQFEDDEKYQNVPEDSPQTYYRRILRNRNK